MTHTELFENYTSKDVLRKKYKAVRNSLSADTRAVLSGEDRTAHRAISLLNGGAAILVAGQAKTLGEGIRKAEESIDSGAAMHKLEQLIRSSRND